MRHGKCMRFSFWLTSHSDTDMWKRGWDALTQTPPPTENESQVSPTYPHVTLLLLTYFSDRDEGSLRALICSNIPQTGIYTCPHVGSLFHKHYVYDSLSTWLTSRLGTLSPLWRLPHDLRQSYFNGNVQNPQWRKLLSSERPMDSASHIIDPLDMTGTASQSRFPLSSQSPLHYSSRPSSFVFRSASVAYQFKIYLLVHLALLACLLYLVLSLRSSYQCILISFFTG